MAFPDSDPLTTRQEDVLRRVVQHFIDTASPVGSKALAEAVELSSASVRSTMRDLEDAGYLGHPHTSAGRVPTERGYRTYVDSLMDVTGLSDREASLLRESIRRRLGDLEAVARETSRLLGRLSQLLGVVLTPSLSTGVLERIEVVPLGATRVLFVLALRGGLARTVAAEVDVVIDERALDGIVRRLNERLAGHSLEEIRRTGRERVRDLAEEDGTGIVRVVLRDGKALFREVAPERRAAIGGAQHLVAQPEFSSPEWVRDVVELAESEDVVVHLLETPRLVDPTDPDRAVVLIGREVGRGRPGDGPSYSVVTAPYRLGDGVGAVAVLGPTRMDYSRAVGLVEYVASLLGDEASD
ncbi:heat-inducible transcription repressor HrcA [Rubrivirga sp. SAORIC476]|uniref:heat-inducible transcriptional repressor HrcA n=1 Tax=Rubrivirga sp. SAORIC476 TaxID=1961794 RepID=UPI000BA9CF0F|nr:heat-inducible transcriptional repressor HrcA [Rubrivirga sp. SAORIC476]PAP80473.1 heat-inducible transcription repressor HrcA [Rubrivirga sp. SAORIC476]